MPLARYLVLLCLLCAWDSANGFPVPLTECASCPTTYVVDLCPNGSDSGGCFPRRVWCDRTDSSPVLIDPGSANTVTLDGTVECRNCYPGGASGCRCPDCPPAPMFCKRELSGTYTESVQLAVAASIEVERAAVEAALESSIGHATQRSITITTVCGWDPFPGCKIGVVDLKLHIALNVRTRVTHSYLVGGVVDNHFLQSCCYGGVQWQNACPPVYSTATGSAYSSGGCSTIRYDDCN